MRKILIPFLLTTLLFGALHETREGLFLQIYAQHDAQSKIIGEISTEKGKIERLRCRGVRTEQWCKVRYLNEGVTLEGWSDKASLDKITALPNTKPYFEQHFGGRYAEEGRALLVLKDGFLLLGTTESFGHGQRDGYLIKTDLKGNKIWSQSYGGGADDELNAMIAMKGGYILAGTTWSMGSEGQRLYVVRTDAKGKQQWENGYYTKKRDRYEAKSIAKLNESHVMVAGSQEHIKFMNGDTYAYLSAIDLKGQQKWEERYGGKDSDRANSIIAVNGGFVFAGYTESWGPSGKNMYVVKIDEHGKRLWHQAFGGDFDDVANQVIATKDGGYLLVGTTNSDHNKLKDVYLVKIDAQGQKEWARHHGGTSNEEGHGVVEVEDGYIVVGWSESTKDLSRDALVQKVDKHGNLVYSKTYGGRGQDAANAVAKIDDGLVVLGYTQSDLDHGRDLYLFKINNEGEFK